MNNPFIDRKLSLAQVESEYRKGLGTYEQLVEYLRAWNAGPHFTQAAWVNGEIKQYDPETPSGKLAIKRHAEEFCCH